MTEATEYRPNYALVLVDPVTIGIVGVVGVFDKIDDAVEFANNDEMCQKDCHWTVVEFQEVSE
tara:strand:+ start:116 stop:304 length:189 start_codon:yes stop_codon:yes gene_type:complete